MAEIEIVRINKKDDEQVIIGHAGFIKTVEDLYEAMVCSVPGVKFGLAFAEASGPCLIRGEGNDESMKALAERNLLALSAGHTFMIIFKGAFPINVANAVKAVPEVTNVYCATANAVQVLVVRTDAGSGVIGVIDGSGSRGIEGLEDRETRIRLLRDLGYKR